jgi:hypothetical protein
MGPFGLGDGTFDSKMVNLVIIISVLPLGFEVCVRTLGNCEYGSVGGKVLGLLQGFLRLLRRSR